MPVPNRREFGVVVGGGMGAVVAGCGSAAQSASPISAIRYAGRPPLRIVCTTGQVAELARHVGGQDVVVVALMGPGVDPHLYRPVASDVLELSEADAVVYSGLHLEGRLTALFERMSRSKATFPVTAGLVARHDARLRQPPDFAGLYDPHVWHDPRIWADCSRDLGDFFAAFDPQRETDYRRRAAQQSEALMALDGEVRSLLSAIAPQRRVLVTAHDAFAYFGAAYDLEVYGLKGVSTEEEKDFARQDELQQMLIKRGIPAVFVESAVAPKTVQAIVEPCRAAGLDLRIGGELYADAMGPAGSDAESYAGMLRHNARVIAAALAPAPEKG